MSLLGKLSLDAIPYNVPILVGTFAVVAIAAVVILALSTYYKKWGVLWRVHSRGRPVDL